MLDKRVGGAFIAQHLDSRAEPVPSLSRGCPRHVALHTIFLFFLEKDCVDGIILMSDRLFGEEAEMTLNQEVF